MTIRTCVGYITQHEITQYGMAAWGAMWHIIAAKAESRGNRLLVYETTDTDVSNDLGPYCWYGSQPVVDPFSELVMPPDGMM